MHVQPCVIVNRSNSKHGCHHCNSESEPVPTWIQELMTPACEWLVIGGDVWGRKGSTVTVPSRRRYKYHRWLWMWLRPLRLVWQYCHSQAAHVIHVGMANHANSRGNYLRVATKQGECSRLNWASLMPKFIDSKRKENKKIFQNNLCLLLCAHFWNRTAHTVALI